MRHELNNLCMTPSCHTTVDVKLLPVLDLLLARTTSTLYFTSCVFPGCTGSLCICYELPYAIGWFCGLSHSCVMASILFSCCAVSFSVVRLSENMSFMGIFDCWSLCMVGHISSMCFCDSSGTVDSTYF